MADVGPRVPLPIDAAIPEILAAIARDRMLVLVAPPGAGKTTRVPPALLAAGLFDPGHPNLVMLQPRRVATRAVATRIADENGWEVGGTVGYQVRFERKIGPSTRIRVVTEGILNRQLVNDPFLEGVGAVILDEFHERSIHTDLALGLLKEVRDAVRDDLILVVMSATLAAEPVAEFLGGAPIVRVEGRTFPVEVVYRGSSGDPLPDRMARAIEAEVGANPVAARGSDILAFLPGVDEIRRTARMLATIADRAGLKVVPLHGSLPPDEQDRALRPASGRKVVLATNIAETSITIDGVSVVIDGGLARRATYDPARGIDRLVLGRISRASADQRAGRAGRTGPGRCVRLWSERESRGMDAADPPEIDRVDLAATLLALQAWGHADPARFGWFDRPDPDRVAAAEDLLGMLGAIDPADGRPTEVGRALLNIPAPPRLGRLLLGAARAGLAREGATIAAILSERDILPRADRPGLRPARPDAHGPSDVLLRLDRFAEAEASGFRGAGVDAIAARRVAQARDDLLHAVRRESARPGPAVDADETLLRLLVGAFPDRVCRRRAGDPMAGRMVGGRGVRLEPGSVVRDGEFFLALDPRDDRAGPGRESRVRIASIVRPEWLGELFPGAIVRERSARFDEGRGRVVGVHSVRYRDLVLEEGEHAAVDPDEAARVLAAAVAPRGRAFLDEISAASAWLARLELLRRAIPEADLPAIDDDAAADLIAGASAGRRSLDDLRAADWVGLLRGCLSYAQARFVDEQAPDAIVVPTGNRVRLVYERGRPPVLAARLQELFGWTDTPRIANGRVAVVVHLLGPNYRPVQVTDDLRSFWSDAYFQVRKDLRNRYPKHAWPDDPTTAKAEARGGRRTN